MGTYHTKHGVITLNNDPKMEQYLAQHSAYDYEDVAACLPYVENKKVLDIGAHVGLWSIPVSKVARSVISVEAQSATHALLQKNITDNAVSNIETMQCIIGNAEKKYAGSHGTHSGTNYYREGTEESAVPLDSFAGKGIEFIKIDVEGMEIAVLESGKKLLAERPWLFIEVNPKTLRRSGYRTSDIPKLFSQCNFYRCYKGVFYRAPFFMNSFFNVLVVPKEHVQPKAQSFLSFVLRRSKEKVLG